MNFDDILRNFWSSKTNVISSNTHQSGFLRNLTEGYKAYYNSELVKTKRGVNQINEKKRLVSIDQKFEDNNFNFTKIDISEVVLSFKGVNDFFYIHNKDIKSIQDFDHGIIVNKWPICQFHSLFVPFLQEKFSQKIDSDALYIVLKIMKLMKNKNLRVGFNSQGAFSTVNHLHFQSVFIEDLFFDEETFPIENSKRIFLQKFEFPHFLENEKKLIIELYITDGYPVKSLIIKNLSNEMNEEISLSLMADIIGIISIFLIEENIAHNFLISNMGNTIYIIPRKNEAFNGRKNDFKCAWLEVCGLAVCRNEQIFKELSKDEYVEFLKENLNIEEDLFVKWIEYILYVFQIFIF